MSSSVSFADHTTSRIILKAAVPSAVLSKCLGTYLEANRLSKCLGTYLEANR